MSWTFAPPQIKLSIANKLVLLYSLSTLFLLGAIGVFLYPTFHQLLAQSPNKAALTIECLKMIILSLLFAAIFILVLGNYIAKKTLNHIKEFQKTMETISAHALNERMSLTHCPNELRPLAICFNNMLERINQGFIQLNQFSSDIAHELRHPIHNLKQITELSLTSASAPTPALLQDYMTQLDLLSQLIEKLLFMARSENGQIKVHKQPVLVKDALENVVNLYQAWLDEKDIQFTMKGNTHTLNIDVPLFQRAMSNLLGNALKYTSKGGEISIYCEKHPAATRLTILDTGCGIESQHIPHLCNRLYRVDTTRNQTEQEGLGLGLALVKSIMDLHHGEVHIESQPGSGTKIILSFP